ncbi:uncharacterized protein TNCV_4568521 [Trichonephila clavipes]|nr:uncharacterized protein TNCV_4568521 [Trichonephila clavipes]
MRCIGQGLESLKTFCAVMSLPNPVEHKSHDVINNKLSCVMKEVAEESMKMAAVKEYSSSPDNLLTVSGDGTWKTRGHSSLIGVCTVIGAETGDGDTKTFNALSENKPYGDDYLIQKIECVGYVQKRMGTRLRKLILVYSKKKLSDGKTIGGKGRLTDSLIDKLAHYYGNAIRCNSTSVKEMRKAIWAVFGVILAALMMNRCTGFVLQIQIHGASGNLLCEINDAQNYLLTEGLNIHRCAQKIRALQTVLEAKREEFVDDALIYAKRLCEELEISFEPPRRIRRKHIFGNEIKDVQLSHEDDLRRTMFSSIDRVTAEIRERLQQLQNLAQKYAFLRPEVIVSMDELNLDQAPQDINKEEFQLERVRLQAFVAETEPRCKKELIRSG